MPYALSIRQPWAEMILQGEKTIETRKWDTRFRGLFYIHSPITIDEYACEIFNFNKDSLVTGAIVGKAELIDTKEYVTYYDFLYDEEKHKSKFYGFANPLYGFVLKNAERVGPIPTKGKLGFFKIEI